MSGGKDGAVCLWDESLSRCLKSYKLNQASLATGQPKDVLLMELPAIRAVTLGQGKILVGTKNGEVSFFQFSQKFDAIETSLNF